MDSNQGSEKTTQPSQKTEENSGLEEFAK